MIYDWSTTAASNANADASINWAEGQPPSTVNNSGRQMMAHIRAFVSDLAAVPAAGGSATVLTLASTVPISDLGDGLIVGFSAMASSTGAATLNVNGLGAKSIRRVLASGDAPIVANTLRQGGVYLAIYRASANGAAGGWVLINPTFDFTDGADPTAATITALTTKATPVDADAVVLTDSAVSNVPKRTTWANVKSVLKTYFDTLYVPLARTITAGNGMTGGGTLAADRTITMGTPTSISNGSTNAVTSNSHAHALAFVAAEVHPGSSNSETNLPVGYTALISTAVGYNRNTNVDVYLAANNFGYADAPGGSQLQGTWRARGYVSALNLLLVERTA